MEGPIEFYRALPVTTRGPTKGILESITIKTQLYKKYIKKQDNFWFERYIYSIEKRYIHLYIPTCHSPPN